MVRIPRRRPDSRSEYFSGPGRWKGRKFDSFQDPHSKSSYRNGHREHKTSSFQDPISRPLRTYNEESLVVSDYEPLEQPTEDLAAELLSRPFRSTGYKSAVKSTSRRVISRPQPTVHEAVESNSRQKLTPFKTPVHVQDRDLIHFKTLGKSGNKGE